MTVRACKDCGELVEGQWRCDRCKRDRGQQPTRYNGAHQRKRKAEKEQQWGKPCCRCGLPMVKGWHEIWLDHNDSGIGWMGWSHKECNIGARNRLHNNGTGGHRRHTPNGTVWQPPAKLDRDPEWGDGYFRPDGTPLRQHAADWCPEVLVYPQLEPGWTPPASS